MKMGSQRGKEEAEAAGEVALPCGQEVAYFCVE